MQTAEQFEVTPHIEGTRSWKAFAASAVLHAVIILLLLFGIPTSTPTPAGQSEDMSQPIALPEPLPAVARNQQKPAPAPKPITKETVLGPDTKIPSNDPKELGPPKPMTEPVPDPPKPADPAPNPPAQEQPKTDPPVTAQPRTIPKPGEAGAMGVFAPAPTSPWGPPTFDNPAGAPKASTGAVASSSGAMGRSGLANRDTRDFRPSFDHAQGECPQVDDLGTNPDGTPVLATLNGTIYDEDGRTPLAGAHLEVMGTAFNTFTHSDGSYRLEFNPKLLERCRTQWVRVRLAGYADQSLQLAIGVRVKNDDVILKRHH